MSLLRNRSIIAAALGHFSVDLYAGMVPLILLLLTDPLHLSYAQVGLASTTFSLTSSVMQPLFGWAGDRWGSRLMAVLGVAAIATTVGLMRFVDSFSTLILLGTVAGLGSAAFHPQGALLATHAPPEQRGSAMSIFMLGGNVGFAIGPLFASFVFTLAGAYTPELLTTLGLAQAALISWALATQHQLRAQRLAAMPAPSAARAAVSVMITLGLVIFFRSWVHSSISTYIPQVYKALGFSTTFASIALVFILLPLAFGGLIGGILSDQVGRRRVLIASTALSGPALWLLLQTAGPASFLVGPLLGLVAGASLPVTLVMAQSLIPRGQGLMSGVVMGFTFIAGALGVSTNGFIADQIGLLTTLNLNAILPLAAAVLAILLPDDRPRPD